MQAISCVTAFWTTLTYILCCSETLVQCHYRPWEMKTVQWDMGEGPECLGINLTQRKSPTNKRAVRGPLWEPAPRISAPLVSGFKKKKKKAEVKFMCLVRFFKNVINKLKMQIIIKSVWSKKRSSLRARWSLVSVAHSLWSGREGVGLTDFAGTGRVWRCTFRWREQTAAFLFCQLTF